MAEKRPFWWPSLEQKRHADAACSHPDYCNLAAACGATIDHDPHGNRSASGKTRACDGRPAKSQS